MKAMSPLPSAPRAATLVLLFGLGTAAGLSAPSAALAQLTVAAPASAPAAESLRIVRPEFALALQPVQALLAEGKAAEALGRMAAVEAVPNRTPWETWVMERTRAAAAQQTNNTPVLLSSLDAALATDQAEPAEQLKLIEVMVNVASRAHDHARVIRWAKRYRELGGTQDGVSLMAIQAQAASGDSAGAQAAMLARVEAAEKAGQPVPESHLRMLLSLQFQAKDAGARQTLERLVRAYPRPEYWSDLVSVNARLPNLSDRALLELYRLLRATGNLKQADLRSEMAQLSLRQGFPAEAQAIVDEGYANGQLGKGAQAAEHNKLRDQIRRAAHADKADRPAAEAAAKKAADGTGLADLGWALVSAAAVDAPASAIEPGLALIEQGVAKGGLKRATEVRLHLGMAQLAAGRKDAARQTLSALTSQLSSNDPLADAVRAWSLLASAPAMLPPRQ